MHDCNQSIATDRRPSLAGRLAATGLGIVAGFVAFLVSGPHAAAESSVKGEFLPAWDVVCGSGKDLAEGCAAVRTRQIVDAAQGPWRAIGRVNFSGHRTRSHCTGALIAERLVLTAAHCFFDDITKQWLRPDRIHFRAGYQRGAHAAHSVAARYLVSGVHDTGGRTHRYDPLSDWALIELREPVGADTGYLALNALDGAGLQAEMASGGTVAFAGYSRLRPHVLSLTSECGAAAFRSSESGGLITAACAAIFGDSGGPVLLVRDGRVTIVAMLSGITVRDGKPVNTALPVANVMDEIRRALDAADAR